MKLARTRSGHGADLDLPPERSGPVEYLQGVRRELSQMERPGAGALWREVAAVLVIASALGGYLVGADRLIAEVLSLVF